MKDKFNPSRWRKNQLLEEMSIFKIDPDMAHKIWDLINKEAGNDKFNSKFPTASGFFHFLNNGLTKD